MRLFLLFVSSPFLSFVSPSSSPPISPDLIWNFGLALEVLDGLYEEVYATRDSDRAVFCPRHHSWILESSIF